MHEKVDEKLLQGGWLHAHEEDVPGKMVYRPDTYPLPPSRGRTGYRFQPDGQLLKLGPGPADRSSSTEGTWHIDKRDQLVLHMPGASPEVLEIDELGPDRLVLKR